MKKILLFSKYGNWEENSYYRFFQYFQSLKQNGFFIYAYPLFSKESEKSYLRNGKPNFLQKLYSYIRRAYVLFTEDSFDGIWLDSELFPYIPFGLENLFFSVDTPIVFDLQNSFYSKYSHGRGYIQKKFLSQKIPLWIARSQAVIVANHEIENFAKIWNPKVFMIPFLLKESFIPVQKESHNTHEIAIGWTGSPYTSKFLISIFDCLRELKRVFPIKLYLIGGNKNLNYPVKTEILSWNKKTEISLLSKANIAINPFPKTLGDRDDSPVRLLKYMLSELPIITSPFEGIEIYIDHAINGFIAHTQDDWYLYLRQLLEDENLRKELGSQAKGKLEASLKIETALKTLLEVFEDVF